MIVFPIHILATPLALVLAALDSYVLTTALFLITDRLVRKAGACWHPAMERIITAPAEVVERRIARHRVSPVPRWWSWAVVFALALFLRQLLAALILPMT